MDNLQKLLDAARQLSADIETEQRQYAETQRLATTLRDQCSKIEQTTMMAIAGAKVEGTGKPMYSNEASRAAELTERLARDVRYQQLVTQRDSTNASNAGRLYHIERLQRDFTLARLEYEAAAIGRRQ